MSNKPAIAILSLFLWAGVGEAVRAADDFPSYDPPAVAHDQWTGFYVGGHVGSGWGDITADATFGPIPPFLPVIGPFAVSSHGIDGFVGGVHLGYDHQVGENVVVGIEGSFSASGIEGAGPCLVILSCSTEVNWIGDVSGRFGVTAGDALLYVKGGVVWADMDHSATFALPPLPFSATFSGSETHVGALLGTGVEYMFAPNWSARVEYSYMDFGSESVPMALSTVPPLPPGATLPVTAGIDSSIHTITTGISYRF